MNEIVWNAWGPPVRVCIERSPVWSFARALTDHNPVHASMEAALAAGFASIPCPPTFTFAMRDTGAWPDLQPPTDASARAAAPDTRTADYTARRGLYLHGEQEFVYHRTPLVGDVLEGRMRVSEPQPKEGGRRPMELTWYETVWADLDGNPVVTERITSIFLPDGPPA